MPEERHSLSLTELLGLLRQKIEDAFPKPVWLCAEISEIKVNSAGHCYITLIEKDEQRGGIAAKAQGIIWNSTFRMIRPFFETTTGQRLEAGMNILVRVQAQYNEVYGFSLIINDIDPTFTVGKMELERQKTIERLTAEGMMEMNRLLKLPALPRRFAIISGQNAAGYGDFMKHLHNNIYGFRFETDLYPAPLQGNEAPSGIIAALETIWDSGKQYDAVMIIRGGGAVSDLACFDDYLLCANIAQFPLPVFTAIGHDRDYHIADMVAFMNVKTPTALADFIIETFEQEDLFLSSIANRLFLAIKAKESEASGHLDLIRTRIANAIETKKSDAVHKLDLMEYRVSALNPESILKKGFALPLKNGGRIQSAKQLAINDTIELILADGKVECEIKQLLWKTN
ncbi:MAG: exodeoxyribonuclease VII large subunit [Bacteroidales bacterium]|nr:exodeoxyribonuclease VII large subunit [Bacteroidales bacterium]